MLSKCLCLAANQLSKAKINILKYLKVYHSLEDYSNLFSDNYTLYLVLSLFNFWQVSGF